MILNPPSFCTLSGVVKDLAGGPVANAFVRVRILGGVEAVAGNVAISSAPVTVYADAEGVFSVTLPQGALARIEIPESDLDASFTVPMLATATLANVTITEYDP